MGAPRNLRSRRIHGLGAALIGAAAALATMPIVSGHADAPSAPSFSHWTVDPNLAGGEPLVAYEGTAAGGPDLVYTSHEGTTHLFRDGIADPSTVCDPNNAPENLPAGFACSYVNQVNVWTSSDHGVTWTRTTVGPCVGTGCTGPTSPFGLGFSDPDLSTDEAGWVYDTGIDLANDAVFASHDGGRSFPVGNNNCHSGDRPWLAGGDVPSDMPSNALSPPLGEVFLATDTAVDATTQLSSGHEIFRGLITGVGPAQTLQCYGAAGVLQQDVTGGFTPGIADYGAWQTTGSYSAAGKLFYDHNNLNDGYHGALIDPAYFNNANNSAGVGISILPNADQAFAPSSGVTQFPQHYEVSGYSRGGTPALAHWPSIALDSNDVVYLVWDTPDVDRSGNYQNAIMLSTFDLKHPANGFTTPITIAQASSHPVAGTPSGTVLWPWVTVGAPGNVNVVWYQYDALTQPDPATTGNVFVMTRSIFGVNSGSPTFFPAQDAGGGAIHTGGICQGGTTCVATGQDRRLGDFFTNAVDENGCVMIATGETRTAPNAATSRPLYIQQTSGTSLTGQSCGVPAAALPEIAWPPLLVVTGGAAALVAVRARRRRGDVTV